MTQEEYKEYLIDPDETVHSTYEEYYSDKDQKRDAKRAKKNPEAVKQHADTYRIIVSDRRVYTDTVVGAVRQQNIIDLDAVKFVNYSVITLRRRVIALIVIGIILALAGAITAIVGSIAAISPNPKLLLPLGIGIAAVGVILLIVGIAVRRKHYDCHMTIGTSGDPIEVDVADAKPDTIKSIQRGIFEAKDHAEKKKRPTIKIG